MPRKSPGAADKVPTEAALTRERIAEVALEQLSQRGLEGFSLRDVARTLGVYPTAIYWYVRSKNDLVTEACALAIARIAPPRAKDRWQDWLRELFRRYREVMRRHPHLAQVVGSQLLSNATLDLALLEGILATLEDAGCPDSFIPDAYNAVVAALCGFATLEFAPLPNEESDRWTEQLQRRIQEVTAQRHPTLARHLPALLNRAFILRWQNGHEQPLDAGFNAYVDAFLEGLESQIRQRRHRRKEEGRATRR